MFLVTHVLCVLNVLCVYVVCTSVHCVHSCPSRWGHSGYKELHPEDFVSSLSEEEELDEEPSRAKRKKNGGKDSKQKHKKR